MAVELDLFCGAGGACGASLGLLRAGWDVCLATDIDRACSRTYQANLPGGFLTADLRLLDENTSRPSDWIYVFDIDIQPGANGRPAPIRVVL